jgi:signal transduction histidine kinase
MTLRDFYLICFGAAASIHGVQTVLAARLLKGRTGQEKRIARNGFAIGAITFVWQFGNFLAILGAATVELNQGVSASPSVVFEVGNALRDCSLVCFPLLFAFMSEIMPEHGTVSRRLLGIGRWLRYPLLPWTLLAFTVMLAARLQLPVPCRADLVAQITLFIMLGYFVLFGIVTMSYRMSADVSKVAAVVRAQKAGVVASIVAVGTFVVMLFGVRFLPAEVMGFVQLAAMLSSVPFVIAIAYRLCEFPFMDTFIREVLAGIILLTGLTAAFIVGTSVIWVSSCAVVLAFLKAPLTRWVERKFLGYEESAEQQEERVGGAIRALTRLDEISIRVPEVLATELDAEWVEITATDRPDASQALDVPGAGLKLSLGPRRHGRQYMSRQHRIARTAALQLAAHHHQLAQVELKELTARAQVRALQAQINPHFLFNTLNVLASLIHSDPLKAEMVTEELADVFRYALESTRQEWVTLDDELQFLEAYLGIEKARFDERLRFSFDVDSSLRSMKIPPMILQPLVENAVKHGISPLQEGGEVCIRAQLGSDRVIITVEDTGAGRRAPKRGRTTGVGLVNVRERLDHIYGPAGSIQLEEIAPKGMRAVLTLPQLAGVHS